MLTVLVALLPSVVIAAASGGPALADGARAKQPVEVVVHSDEQKLVSSTGKTLYLEVEAESDAFHDQPPSSEFLFYVAANSGEEHDWNWSNIATGDLTYDGTVGAGSILTETQLDSWGSVDLTIAPRSASPTTSCGGDEQDWAVTLSGTLWFNTHTAAWGAFGTMTVPLTFSVRAEADEYLSTKALQGSCSTTTEPRCNGQVSWDDGGGWHGGTNGQSVRHDGVVGGQLFYFFTHTLDGGNGPQRDDLAFLPTIRPPKVVTTAHGKTKVVVQVRNHHLFTGSATLTGIGRPVVRKNECRGGTTSDWNASYTPGPNPLTVHLAIGGDYTHPARKSGASFTIESH